MGKHQKEPENKFDAALTFAVLQEAKKIYIPKSLRGKIDVNIKNGNFVVNKKGKTTE